MTLISMELVPAKKKKKLSKSPHFILRCGSIKLMTDLIISRHLGRKNKQIMAKDNYFRIIWHKTILAIAQPSPSKQDRFVNYKHMLATLAQSICKRKFVFFVWGGVIFLSSLAL